MGIFKNSKIIWNKVIFILYFRVMEQVLENALNGRLRKSICAKEPHVRVLPVCKNHAVLYTWVNKKGARHVSVLPFAFSFFSFPRLFTPSNRPSFFLVTLPAIFHRKKARVRGRARKG